jgi:hypothetical protein
MITTIAIVLLSLFMLGIVIRVAKYLVWMRAISSAQNEYVINILWNERLTGLSIHKIANKDHGPAST